MDGGGIRARQPSTKCEANSLNRARTAAPARGRVLAERAGFEPAVGF